MDILKFSKSKVPQNYYDYIAQVKGLKGNFNLRINKENKENKVYEVNCKIKDLYSYGYSKLEVLASTLGIQVDKELKEGKNEMEKNLLTKEDRKTFLDYAINDVLILEKINNELPIFINKIFHQLFKGLKFTEFTTETLPGTYGGIVNELILIFIHSHFGELDAKNRNPRFEKINKKLGIKKHVKSKTKKLGTLLEGSSQETLLTMFSNTSAVLGALIAGGRTINNCPEKCVTEEALDIDIVGCYTEILKNISYPVGLPIVVANTMDQKKQTLKQFLKEHENNLHDNLWTIIVSGNLTFDQDLIYSKLTTAEKIEKQFNKSLDKSLKGDSISRTSDSDLIGDHIILTQELKNSILTSDLLHAIKKIASSKEYAEILNTEVETAIYYSKSDELSKEDFLKYWENFSTNDINKMYTFDTKTQSIPDVRPRKWTKIPLEKMMTLLQNIRKEYKTEAKNYQQKISEYEISEEKPLEDTLQKENKFSESPVSYSQSQASSNQYLASDKASQPSEVNYNQYNQYNQYIQYKGLYNQYNGLQLLAKEFSNTIYGLIASSYYPIGNTVVANVITGSARLHIWQISKVIGGVQDITDGTLYDPKKVVYLKKDLKTFRKPGLNEYANINIKKNNSIIKKNILENENQKILFDQKTSKDERIAILELMNKKVEKHIAEHWNLYKLPLPVRLEHKIEQIALRLFYLKKAHYMILTPDGIYIQKVRGLDPSVNSTVKQIGTSILYDTPIGTISLHHEEEHLNTVTDYLNSIKKDIKDIRDVTNVKDLEYLKETKIIRYPGYIRIVERKHEHLN